MIINKKVSSFGFQVFNNQKPQTKNPKPIKKNVFITHVTQNVGRSELAGGSWQ